MSIPDSTGTVSFFYPQFTDPFGIAKLNRSSPNGHNSNKLRPRGWEYYASLWNKLMISEFVPNGAPLSVLDPYMHYSATPGAFCNIQGDGRITITSEDKTNPFRLSIYDQNNFYPGHRLALQHGMRWTPSVEFTFYFSIGAYASNRATLKGGIQVHMPNDHHFIDDTSDINATAGLCPLNAHDYYLHIGYDGRMYLGGEPYHVSTRSERPVGNSSIDYWDTAFSGIPTNTLYGIKVIQKVVDGGKGLAFEVYRDTTGGANGGEWVYLFGHKHVRGNWAADPNSPASYLDLRNISASNLADSILSRVPYDPDDPLCLGGGGGQVFLQLDAVNSIDIKWLSCRDIEPSFLPPVTTDAELTAESTFFDDTEGDVL